MIFKPTKLAGVFILEPDRFEDERGYFAQTWSEKEFAERGLESHVAECNRSFNGRQGTVRGMHYQAAPFSQVKVVGAVRGAIFDVVLDLRSDSPTFKHWVAAELSADNGLFFYVPAGCAHGFQTLRDQSVVAYQMFAPYVPEYASGVRWNDPAFAINWPLTDDIIINQRDRDYPDFES